MLVSVLRAPQRDCLLVSAGVPAVPIIDVDNDPALEPLLTGRLAEGPAGFFLKSFINLSMLPYVFVPQMKPSGEMPMVC